MVRNSAPTLAPSNMIIWTDYGHVLLRQGDPGTSQYVWPGGTNEIKNWGGGAEARLTAILILNCHPPDSRSLMDNPKAGQGILHHILHFHSPLKH